MTPALEAREITKRYPGVVACDGVSFELRAGEIHALLGENGAGKTTLMNILCGLVRPDAGEILLQGEPVRFGGPRAAIERGIGMVHQHFMLVPPLSVAENVMLGQEATRPATRLLGPLALLDRGAAGARIRELGRRHGLAVDPEARVEDLSVGERQRVEILKALYRQARVLILDEPTAVLTPQEADDLFAVMRALARAGTPIVFITHKLREVLAVADRISVLRRGRMVGTVAPADASPGSLAELMVGRTLAAVANRPPAPPGEVVLRVEGLRARDGRRAPSAGGVSLEVRAGEILGIAGVLGNGQTECVEALVGLRPVAAGSVWLAGELITGATARRVAALGVAHVPEDRQKHGLVLSFPVRDNLVLCTYFAAPFAHGRELDLERIEAQAQALVREYDVRTPGTGTSVGALSGGNQQKVVIARELARPARLLIVNQPTRGLDVGSVQQIHTRILAARDRGTAVLLVSADLDEVLALSDRIAVMVRGSIVHTLAAGAATREQLGLLMAGEAHAAGS
jgi:simple sugar transport system ATP-binding protein